MGQKHIMDVIRPDTKLTPKLFDQFMIYLGKYNFNYMHSEDRRVYNRGKYTAGIIEALIRNPELKAIYDLWERDKINKSSKGANEIAKIREALVAEFESETA